MASFDFALRNETNDYPPPTMESEDLGTTGCDTGYNTLETSLTRYAQLKILVEKF